MKFVSRSEMLDVNKTTETIIGAAIEVHRHLGPGYLNQHMKNAYVRNCP